MFENTYLTAAMALDFGKIRRNQQQKRLLQVFWVTEFALLIAVISQFYFSDSNVIYIVLAYFVLLLPSYPLAKQGKLKFAGNWLLITVTLLQLTLLWQAAGLRDEILLITPAIIMFSIYIGSYRLFIWLLAITVLNIVGIGVVDQLGIYIHPKVGSGIYPAFNILIILLIISYTVWLVAKDLKNLNQSLLDLNAELNEKVKQRTAHLESSLEQLKATQQQLIEQEKMASLGRLITGVAHEVNTPLGICITALSNLKHDQQHFATQFSLNKVSKSLCQHTIENTEQAIALIENNLQRTAKLIQTFKTVAIDQTDDQLKTIDIEQYIQELVFSFEHELLQNNITLKLDLQQVGEVTTYIGALAIIVTNLIENVITHAFGAAENQDKTLSIALMKQQQNIILTVIDNGKGITAEVQKQIFDPFFTTSRTHGGTGLGLHIAFLQASQKLKGELSCQSKIEQGTKFVLKFAPSLTDTTINAPK